MTRTRHFMAALMASACLYAPAYSIGQDTAGEPAAMTAAPVQLSAAMTAALADQPDWMKDVYAERGDDFVWTGMFDRPSRNFNCLEDALHNAAEEGALVTRQQLSRLEAARRATPEEREVIAARVLAETVETLRHGVTTAEFEIPEMVRAENQRGRYGDILRAAYDDRDPSSVIADALQDNFIVTNLLEARDRYVGYRDEGGWQSIAFDERKLEAGAIDEAIPAVRARLQAEGFETGFAPENPELYDDGLVAAIEAFQRSRSMMVDGIIGPNTIDALNESVEALITKIDLNIERARWLPDSLGEKAAFVNIADYQLRMLKDDRIVDQMDVIVGERDHQTPVFADVMETVVINPYWNVPDSITIAEIAPQVLNNPNHIASQNMEVIAGGDIVSSSSVDWAAAARGNPTFRVRQRPGPSNALGQIKFLFPNKYAVYLHDTPADQLFSRDRRTFSHGCVRVEDPLRFAQFVTENISGWDARRVEQAIQSGERVELQLEEQFPVYMTYFTAWSDPDGTVSFARDIYDRDERVINALSTRI